MLMYMFVLFEQEKCLLARAFFEVTSRVNTRPLGGTSQSDGAQGLPWGMISVIPSGFADTKRNSTLYPAEVLIQTQDLVVPDPHHNMLQQHRNTVCELHHGLQEGRPHQHVSHGHL